MRVRGESLLLQHRRVVPATLAAAAAWMSMLLLVAPAAAPAQHGGGLPIGLSITVVAASHVGPRPTGRIAISVDGRRLLSVALPRGIDPSAPIVARLAVTLTALQRRVTVSYSGDAAYAAGDSVTVTIPTSRLVTIVAQPRDREGPRIELLSPGDGVGYALGQDVVARYSCADPGDRSPVASCNGPVASGAPVDTATAGTFSFDVNSADAAGNATSKSVTYSVGGAPAGASSSAPAQPVSGSGDVDARRPAPPPTLGGAPAAAAPPVAAPLATVPAAGSAAARRATAPAAGSTGASRSTSSWRRSASGRRATGAAGAGSRPAGTSGSSLQNSARRVRQELLPYDPRSEPTKMVGILVAAFTLLQIAAGRRGLALAGGGGGVAGTSRRLGEARRRDQQQASRPEHGYPYQRLRVEHLIGGFGGIAAGDRSRTWGWPGTRRVDTVAATLPVRLARRSPLLARVLADGTYLRAILGSLSLLGLLAGLALGVVALRDTGADALVPAASLTIAIAVLGVLDAAAGLLAVLTFTIGVLAHGGVSSLSDLRLILGLGALWFVVPVLAGAARPLRRPPTRGLGPSWDRAADFVIASLIGAWAVHKIVLALPGLEGRQLPIAQHANAAALCVLAALVLRLAFETIAAYAYPQRLDLTEPVALPEPGALHLLGASMLRTGLFVLFAAIVVGMRWELYAGAALFVIPQILAAYEERLPNSPALYRTLPKGLTEIVLLLFAATAVGALLLGTMNKGSETFLATSFVLLALPGFLLSSLKTFGREGDKPAIGWGKRIGGVAILVTGVLLALGLLL
jgi:hypothetical protein